MRGAVAILRAGRTLLLAAAVAVPCAAQSATDNASAEVELGRAIYEGRTPLKFANQGAVPGVTGVDARGCVACHRHSGMGNFEGGLAVPPIAGPTLFRALDRDTSHFFAAAARHRVRPAYDQASLVRLLRTGMAPDGVAMHPAMPRYTIGDDEAGNLVSYLRQLSASSPTGIDADNVRIATVTTPDADPLRSEAMLKTLRRFIEQKNGQSRHEAQRAQQSAKTREMVMYRKYRVWQLDHWALQGPASTWAAQLDAFQKARPVFALVGGSGRAQWEPVDAFCKRARTPCLLPLVDAGAAESGGADFYSLHYHAGMAHDAALAARQLVKQGVQRVQFWFQAEDDELARQVMSALLREGLRLVGDDDARAQAVVSVLPLEAHRQRRSAALNLSLVWLPGLQRLDAEVLRQATAGQAHGWIVSPLRQGTDLDRVLARTRAWQRAQGLEALPAEVSAAALQAATVLGEGLAHLDFGFTPEYLLELLEHGLENVVPWSPFPRLSIGPDQRIAVKGSQLGEVRNGAVTWRWQALR